MRIDVIDDSSQFERIKEEWNELLEASASPCFFLSWEWLFTWWRHLSGGRRLFILAVRSDGEPLALAPLVLKSGGVGFFKSFQTLEFLGSGIIGSDYLDLIVRRGREEKAVRALARYLADRKRVLKLSQLKRGAALAAKLAAILTEEAGWSLLESKTDVSPFINLSGHTWSSYLATLGSSHRHNFQRRLKNLHKQFEVRFEQVVSEEQRREAIPLLMDLHNRRWQERRCSESFYTADLRAFHEDLSRLALERGWLRLFVLWLDGKPAASLYGFLYHHTFYFFQSGFDPGYGKHSVGLVTMGLAIQSAIGEGAREYDLLHGDEPYKFLWAREARELGRMETYPPNAAGFLCKQALGLSRSVKKMARRILPATLVEKVAAARSLRYGKRYYATQAR